MKKFLLALAVVMFLNTCVLDAGSFPRMTNGSTGEFYIGNAPVTSSSSWVKMVDASGNDTLLTAGSSGRVWVQGSVDSSGAIAHFKVTAKPTVNGAETDLLVDADFNTPNAICTAATSNLYQTTASGSFLLVLDVKGAAGLCFYAEKSSSSTFVTLTGTVVSK